MSRTGPQFQGYALGASDDAARSGGPCLLQFFYDADAGWLALVWDTDRHRLTYSLGSSKSIYHVWYKQHSTIHTDCICGQAATVGLGTLAQVLEQSCFATSDQLRPQIGDLTQQSATCPKMIQAINTCPKSIRPASI